VTAVGDLAARRAVRAERAGATPCEACGAPATTTDMECVPLCDVCAADCIAEEDEETAS
jgi:hypothetical protein